MEQKEKKEMIRNAIYSNIYNAEFTDTMRSAYTALDMVEQLEKLAEKMIGTVYGVELDGVLKKFHDFGWNEKVWKKFYINFNDDNEEHSENALFNQHFSTIEEIEKANEEFLNDTLKHYSIKKIVKIIPEARFFMTSEQTLKFISERRKNET